MKETDEAFETDHEDGGHAPGTYPAECSLCWRYERYADADLAAKIKEG